MKRLYILLAVCTTGMLIGLGLCAFDKDTHSLGGAMSGWGLGLIVVFGIGTISSLTALINVWRMR